jgi:hypothetical protein
MPGAYGFKNWVSQHATGLAISAGVVGVVGIIALAATEQKKKKKKTAKEGFADSARKGCAGCPDTKELAGGSVIRASQRSFVNDAAYQQMRDQGYVGYSYGPLARYPGARGPTPPTPVWGAYGARGRYVFQSENGPAYGPGRVPQSVATREPHPIPDPPIPGVRSARNAISPKTPIGTYPAGFYRWGVVAPNQKLQTTEHYPEAGAGPGNLAIGNFPPGAEGNLSAPATYQSITPPGGIARPISPTPPGEPYLGQGGTGYAARFALPSPGGIPIGPIQPVQSVATAQAAREAFADAAHPYFHSDAARSPTDGELRSFPGWKPHAERGPLGSAWEAHVPRWTRLNDAGGGYVSPSAYYSTGDLRFREYPYNRARAATWGLSFPSGEVFFPIENSPVVGRYGPTYPRLTHANTLDIQTEDYPGGEVGMNLSVSNLPQGADGNLDAPVQYQQLASPGGVAWGEVPELSKIRPWLSQGGSYY